MKINTTRFGELEVNPDEILNFPRGMPGFEKNTRYQLMQEDKDGSVVFYLLSIDDPNVTFSIVNPALFGIFYELKLSDEEVALLQAGSPDDLAVVLIVYRSQDVNAQKTPGGVAANINGPLVLNMAKKLGLQKVLVGPQCDLTLREG